MMPSSDSFRKPIRNLRKSGLDLVILGGGPAGLSAAAEAEKYHLNDVVLEQSEIGNTVRSFPPGKMVYSEPKSMANQSSLTIGRDLDIQLRDQASLFANDTCYVRLDAEQNRISRIESKC